MKHLKVEYDDQDPSRISYEVERDARLTTKTEDRASVLYLNRSAARSLATVFAQLGFGDHQSGFHLHLGHHLDPESAEVLRIVLTE
jgi:hypothetical protein